MKIIKPIPELPPRQYNPQYVYAVVDEMGIIRGILTEKHKASQFHITHGFDVHEFTLDKPEL